MVQKDALIASGFVAVGTSMGGTKALQVLLPALPRNFPATLTVVLHRGSGSDASLIHFLQKYCLLPVEEAQDKTPIQPGHVYIAPADYHLLVEDNHFALTTDEVVSFARPSIDVLFESAAQAYGERSVGIILTGAGRDGARGLTAIKRCGGLTVVQTPTTAERADMPSAAVATGMADEVMPLEEIVPFLLQRRSWD